jgi:hypothetical protein
VKTTSTHPRQGQEILEVRGILFVPEDGRNASAAALAEQIGDLCARTRRARELELPLTVIAAPGGLDEDEVEAVELGRPLRRRQRSERPLIAEALGRELVEDDSHGQLIEDRSAMNHRQGREQVREDLRRQASRCDLGGGFCSSLDQRATATPLRDLADPAVAQMPHSGPQCAKW